MKYIQQTNMQKIANQLIRQNGAYDSFYIANLRILQNKINEWKSTLPTVTPFYAVKCNPDINLLEVMNRNNIAFDCASKHEIKTVLGMNPSAKIGFFNPVKSKHDLTFASQQAGVKYLSFDNIHELDKISDSCPTTPCFIRVKVDNPSARVQLGIKYGALKEEVYTLIDRAKDLNLNIIGTAFHVGSASQDPRVFETGIEISNYVRDYAQKRGYACEMLDIGGGFTKENFQNCAAVINEQIVKYNYDNVIAEPGRFFAEQVYTFFVSVIGIRHREYPQYWVKDGLYGSFNSILYDKQIPAFEVYRNPMMKKIIDDEYNNSTVMFETCDSCDIYPWTVNLPSNMRIGDYLMVRDFGAYTLAGACNFNGINMMTPKIFYIL
jgi:ornithine decarboxylase